MQSKLVHLPCAGVVKGGGATTASVAPNTAAYSAGCRDATSTLGRRAAASTLGRGAAPSTPGHRAAAAYSTVADDGVSLTHLDSKGRAHMVDVGGKTPSSRAATASGCISLSPEAFQLITDPSSASLHSKGDVMGVARVAAIMAAKTTPTLIPLCHPLPLTHVAVTFDLLEEECMVVVHACVKCEGVTGVEMEALTAVSIALLTLYDMTKSAGKGHVISNIQLDSKQGGKSGQYSRS